MKYLGGLKLVMFFKFKDIINLLLLKADLHLKAK
jgi:hypothetical protein